MIALENVSKAFKSGQPAVADVSLDIMEGEFFSLLGPSGCGKTTLLRMIGGFDLQSSGVIRVAGTDMSHRRPDKRPTNMVFQSYALFPHLSVEENVGYGLLNRKITTAERRNIVYRALETIRLSGLGKRRPHELSGGQRQRVALARALVCEQKVLLLDEPLAALDRALREEMQSELRALQKQSGVTFVFVTHDQEEAMALSDRIAVMSRGKLLQVGSPADIYRRPGSVEVASFLGKASFVCVEVIEAMEGKARVRLHNGSAADVQPPIPLFEAGTPARLMLRPEELELTSYARDDVNTLPAELVGRTFLGSFERLVCKVGEDVVLVDAQPLANLQGGGLWLSWPRGTGLLFPVEKTVENFLRTDDSLQARFKTL